MSIQLACFETIFLHCILALAFELVLSFLGMRLYYMSTSGESCLVLATLLLLRTTEHALPELQVYVMTRARQVLIKHRKVALLPQNTLLS